MYIFLQCTNHKLCNYQIHPQTIVGYGNLVRKSSISMWYICSSSGINVPLKVFFSNIQSKRLDFNIWVIKYVKKNTCNFNKNKISFSNLSFLNCFRLVNSLLSSYRSKRLSPKEITVSLWGCELFLGIHFFLYTFSERGLFVCGILHLE